MRIYEEIVKQLRLFVGSQFCLLFDLSVIDLIALLLSVILLHWNEGGNVATADRACLLCLDQLLATILANAEMAAWHNERVFFLRQTDQALGIGVVIIHGLLTFLGTIFGCHTVDRLEFEGKAVDEGDLLDYMDTVDILVAVPLECAIGHHGVLGLTVSVIHRDDHRVVVLNRFSQFKCRQVVDVELNLAWIDLLIDTRLHGHIEDVIITIGRVKHFWCVVRVLLLGYTHVDADVGIAKRVIFERDVQFLIISHSLSAKKYIRRQMQY